MSSERFLRSLMAAEGKPPKISRPYQGPTVRWSKVRHSNLNDPPAAEADEWVPVPGDSRSFYNRTEHLRLVAEGVLPLSELAQTPDPSISPEVEPVSAEARMVRAPERRPMTVAEKPKVKKAWHEGLSKTALRKKLLETPTLSFASWADWREANGLDREAGKEEGEDRTAAIKRILG